MFKRVSTILLPLLLLACGGGGSNGGEPAATATPTASPTASPAPTSTPTPAPTATPTPTPSPTITPAPTPSPTPAPQSFSLSAAADATLYESDDGGIASGAGGGLFAGRTREGSNSLRRLVIRFDTDELPAGRPDTAVLRMTVTRVSTTSSKSFTLHRVLESWTEGASNAGAFGGQGAPAQSGDATWLHRSFDASFWGTEGGVFAQQASGEVTVSGTGEISFQSLNQGMEQDVEAWQANPAGNFGWLVLGNEGQVGSATAWASRENSQAGDRPVLDIDYP